MKLPRWFLWCMVSLSVAAVLAAASWWWVTWPERTARAFFRTLCDERVDDTLEMLGEDPTVPENRDFVRRFHSPRPLELLGTRTLSDVVMGRQMFAIYRNDGTFVLTLTIERRRVFAIAW